MESVESEKSLKTLTDLVKEQNLKQEEEILQVRLQKQENSEENKQILSVLNSVFRVLSDQLAFQKSVELQKEITGQTVPTDYQNKEASSAIEQQSYSKESESGGGLGGGLGGLFGAYGVFSLFKDGLKGLITILKDVSTKLMDFLGIGSLLESFKTGLGGIIGKTGEFLRAISPAIMRFTALAGIIYTVLQGLEKFGEWFRSITGLPSIQNDPFNMRNYTGESQPSNRPMSMEEFEQERISKTVGGESARKERGADGKPMTQEEFNNKRVSPVDPNSDIGLKLAAFTSTIEATGEQNRADVLQSMVNRAGQNYSGYGGLFKQITAKNQYSPISAALGELTGDDPAAKRIYGKLKLTRSELQEILSKPDGLQQLEKRFGGKGDAAAAQRILDDLQKGGELNRAAKEFVGGRTDYRGYSKTQGEIRRGKGGNYYRLAGKNKSPSELKDLGIMPEETTPEKDKLATKMSNQEKVNMVDASELRVKGGLNGQAFKGGETEEGTLNLARALQAQEENIPGGLNRFSSFNDAYHKHANPKSKHTKGLALDFSLKDAKQSTEASDYVKQQLMSSGLSEKDFKIINEYKNPSKHATGGHIHVNFANKEAAEKYAQFTKGGEQTPTYAKINEKQLPEGGKYKEEESEMEEMDEPILKEKISEPKSKPVKEELGLDKSVDSGYKNFFEDMVAHLEKMVSFTEDIKTTNKEMASAEKQSSAKKEEKISKEEQISKENSLSAEKEKISNVGVNPFGDILQPVTGNFGGVNQGNTGGGFGQNPFGTVQSVLGGIGSAVSIGQQMGNMGRYGMGGGMMGGIGAAQGAIGGIQGVLGQMGQNSPMLGGLGQVLGSAGSVMGSIENVKNMGRYGGVLGGINAASGAVGAAGNIFNAIGGMFGSTPSQSGDISASSKKAGQALGSTPTVPSIGDSIGNFFGGMFGSTPSQSGDISASSKKAGQALGSTPFVSDMGIGSDSAAINAKYSTVEDSTKRGFSLENMTRSVETTKEENMTPPEPSAPVTVQQGGNGGGGMSGGSSSDNPPSGGVMGMDIGVRNEEPTLLRAQYGSVRIV